jgi:hypothetical protein
VPIFRSAPALLWVAMLFATACAKSEPTEPASSIQATNDRDAALPEQEADADAAAAEPRTAIECDTLARQEIDSFYETHGDRWELSVATVAGLLKPVHGNCSTDSELSLGYDSDHLGFLIHLSCAELHGATADDLNRAAPVLTLDLLPTGLEVAGCPIRFNALPPSSRVDDAVEVVEIEATRVVLHVRTRLFAVASRNYDEEACPAIADAPSPEECFEQVRQDITLDATFDLPFDGAAFASQL